MPSKENVLVIMQVIVTIVLGLIGFIAYDMRDDVKDVRDNSEQNTIQFTRLNERLTWLVEDYKELKVSVTEHHKQQNAHPIDANHRKQLEKRVDKLEEKN